MRCALCGVNGHKHRTDKCALLLNVLISIDLFLLLINLCAIRLQIPRVGKIKVEMPKQR